MMNRRPVIPGPSASGLTDTLGVANSLTCPRCGNTYLHLITTSSNNDETMIHFECEGCGRGIQISFESRKGHTFMSWVF